MKNLNKCLKSLCAIFALSCLSATGAVLPVDDHACEQMKANQVIRENSPVRCNQLSIVRFSYIDFEGNAHRDGEIMVLTAVAQHVENIFSRLHEAGFPIAKARLMNHYRGNDEASMRDNNTSGFNHRAVAGGSLSSLHAYGLAIDLNPVQNPFIQLKQGGSAIYQPAQGSAYANRLQPRPGKALRKGMAEDAVRIIAENGFLVWGGHWDNPIDYQHFQVSRKLGEQLAALPPEQARILFTRHVDQHRACFRDQSAKSYSLALIACTAQSNK